MGWGRLDDGWEGHPKLLAAGLIARAIQSNAIAYCGHYLTDGYLGADVIPRLVLGVEVLFVATGDGGPTPASSIDWPAYMVEKKLWDRVDNRTGFPYRVHDYLDYNPSRAFLEAERKRLKRYGRMGAKVRWDKEKIAEAMAEATVGHDAPPHPTPRSGDTTRVEKINPLRPVGGGLEGASEKAGTADAAPAWADPPTFEAFWTLYTRKTGKGAARRAWDRLKGGAEVKRQILVGLARQVTWPDWQRENGRFIPNPATWLNQERWLDEPRGVAGTGTDLSGLRTFAAQEEGPR